MPDTVNINTKYASRYLLLAILLLSFGFLFAGRYLTIVIDKLYIDIAFGITAMVIPIVVYLFIDNLKSAARLYGELVLREEYLRETLNSLDEGVITTDIAGYILGMNPSAEHITGWLSKEAVGAPLEQVYDVVNEESGIRFEHVVKRILREEKPVEFENNTILYTKNGRKIIISNSGSPIKEATGKMVGAVLVFRDITEKKMLNDQKKALTNRLLLATKSAGMGIWELDVRNNKLEWDENMYQLYKADNNQYSSNYAIWNHRIHPQDKCRIIDEIRCAHKGLEEYYTEFRIIDDDASLRYIKATGIVDKDKEGNAISMIGTNWDITERKRSEIELKQSEAFSRGILESLSSHIVVVDAAGTIIASNSAWSRFAQENDGVTAKTTVGANYFDVCKISAAAGDTIAGEALLGMKNVLEGIIPFFDLEYPCHAPDKQRWFNMRIVKFQSDEAMIVVSHENITATKQAEQEKEKLTYNLIQRNKKMEQFSHIISHNLRAPVANILGLAGLLKLNSHDINDLPDIVTGMANAAEKLDVVIRDLNEILKLNSCTDEDREYVSLYDIMSDIVKDLDNDIKSHSVLIHTDFDSVNNIYSNKTYIRNIFYNLIDNSIKYRKPDVNTRIELTSKRTPNGLQLIFKDNGIGIDMGKNRNKIFGPYARFHLHAEGKGMGLFMVKSQVETLGGKILVSSEIDIGTEFIIEFEQNN